MFRCVCILVLVVAGTSGLFAQAPPLPPVGGSNPPTLNVPPPDPIPGNTPIPGKRNDPLPPRPGELLPPRPGESPRPGSATSDIELVERVLEARKQYANALKELHAHYIRVGDKARAKKAEEELIAYHRLPLHAYRLDLDVPSPKLQPLYNQPEANRTYQQALNYKGRGFGNDYIDNMRRAEILLQQLLTNYPQSNRISDAAFHLGDIYESRAFRMFERAAAYYERCFQWNPTTHHDARLRAARVYDRELRNKSRALELYRLVREYETAPAQIQEANRRIAELSR